MIYRGRFAPKIIIESPFCLDVGGPEASHAGRHPRPQAARHRAHERGHYRVQAGTPPRGAQRAKL